MAGFRLGVKKPRASRFYLSRRTVNVGNTILKGSVVAFADLPAASDNSGSLFLVKTNTGAKVSLSGLWKYPRGIYFSDGAAWSLTPMQVSVSEESQSLLNITDWAEFFAYGQVIGAGDKLVYGDIQYSNKTGAYSSTTPSLDSANWEKVRASTLLGDHIDFVTTQAQPDYKEGRTFYDPVKKSLSFFTDKDEVTVNLSGEVLFRVTNNTASTLENGTVIAPDPVTEITLADSKIKDKCRVIAVLTQELDPGESGWATKLGQVGMQDTSAFLNGQIVYLGHGVNAGKYVADKPDDGGYVCIVGVIDTVSSTEGVITVDTNASDLTVEVTDTNGFPSDQRSGTLIGVIPTRLFTIVPTGTDFHYYELGDKYESTGDSITFADTEGEHWFFFEGGVLKTEHDPSLQRKEHIILNHAFISTIYWNATDKKVEIDVLDERHGISMSPATHLNLHLTRGAQHIYGFQIGDINADASGDLDTSAQYSITAGEFADEDIRHTSQNVLVGDTIPVSYNLGANASLRSESQAGFAVLNAPAGRLYFNEFTGGAWQVTEAANNDFVLYHDFAINGVDVINIRVMGQAEYATRNAARAAAPQEIANLIAQLPFAEMIPVATMIYQTSDGYANAVKARVISTGDGDYISWIDTEISSGSAPSSHLNLTDVQVAATGVTQGHVDNSKPLQLPELTTAERDAVSPNNGMKIYNTTDNKFQGYENGAWVNMI